MTTPGYADSSQPLDDLVAAAARRAAVRRPVLVWIVDGEDRKSQDTVVTKILSEEAVLLAVQRFACLKGDIRSIPDEAHRKSALRRAPMFCFFDPAGKLVASLERSRAVSRNLFLARLRKVWALSYALPIPEYQRQRTGILDDLDDVNTRLVVLSGRLGGSAAPAAKLASLRQEEEKLIEARERLERDERRLIAGVDLREEFFDRPDDAEKPEDAAPRSGGLRSGR